LGNEVSVIRSEYELAKLFAFLRARVHGKQFVFPAEMLDVLLFRLEEWARDHDVRVQVELATPNGTKVLMFGVGGAMVGAAAAYAATGSPMIALGGAVAGAAVGVAIAHVSLSISMSGGTQGTLVVE